MRALVQRVSRAGVTVDGNVSGKIDEGLLILLGITHNDSEAEAQKLASKIARLRIFNDEAGKMNRSVQDAGGAVLVISQFTLYADARKGNRPSYVNAARPERARPLYEQFSELFKC